MWILGYEGGDNSWRGVFVGRDGCWSIDEFSTVVAWFQEGGIWLFASLFRPDVFSAFGLLILHSWTRRVDEICFDPSRGASTN